MNKALRFRSYFHHERSWSNLKSDKTSKIETLDNTEIFLYRIYQNCLKSLLINYRFIS